MDIDAVRPMLCSARPLAKCFFHYFWDQPKPNSQAQNLIFA
jgi:hypothetical protein